jgi:hypothetical protein
MQASDQHLAFVIVHDAQVYRLVVDPRRAGVSELYEWHAAWESWQRVTLAARRLAVLLYGDRVPLDDVGLAQKRVEILLGLPDLEVWEPGLAPVDHLGAAPAQLAPAVESLELRSDPPIGDMPLLRERLVTQMEGALATLRRMLLRVEITEYKPNPLPHAAVDRLEDLYKLMRAVLE